MQQEDRPMKRVDTQILGLQDEEEIIVHQLSSVYSLINQNCSASVFLNIVKYLLAAACCTLTATTQQSAVLYLP
jgi:hypothetical protein